ncbi:MAG: outer membrane beta-barrel protein [Ferruginibacter sp.]
MKIILSLLCLLVSSTLAAQTTRLQVIVVNEKQQPFQNATVSLYLLPDSILKEKKIAKTDTWFEVNTRSKYLLTLTAVGTQPANKEVTIEDSSVSVTMILAGKISNLGNVTVVARKPLIRQDDDKTVVDAEALANSSTNAYEILEKTPGTIVDQDGNVYLSSTTPATIFINGREMKLSNTDIASLLKSLPAGSVSKIEILRSPSAKFDAASSGGIVNIVLKKGVKLGSSGSVNLAHFQGRYGTETGGVNLNRTSGKLTSYLSYQFTNRNNYEDLNSERLTPTDSLVSQKSHTTYPNLNNYFSGGIDYAITKKFNVGYDLRFSNTKGKSYAANPIDIINSQTGAILAQNKSDIKNSNLSNYIGNELSAKYKIDSVGSEWITEVDYYYYKNKNNQNYTNFYVLPAYLSTIGNGENKNDKNIFVFQTDLTLKLPAKFTLETGFKATFSNSRNSAEYFKDSGNGEKFVDLYQTNTFKYKEAITAAYLQVSKTVAGFTFKPGLRLETTNIDGRQFIPKDTSLSIKRTDVFPYVFIKHNLFKMFKSPLVGSLIYRRSIKRPYYETLNPYPKYVDQYLFDVGNPKLTPQFTTNYEVNVMFQNFPVFAMGLNNTKDIFSQVTYQDDRTKIAYRTYDNLGKNKEVYFKLIGGIPPGGKYFFYVGAQYNYNHYEGLYNNRILNYKRASYTFFMYHEFKFTKTFTANLQGFMRTKGVQNFYELNTFGGLFVSVNKAFFNKKANIILSVNDLLQTNRVSFALDQGNVHATGIRINDTRRLGVTLRYNFGGKANEEKKSFETPAEAN